MYHFIFELIIHLIVTDTIRKFGCQARSTQRITDIEESVSSYKRYREQVLRSAARLDFRRATFFWCSCRQRWTDCQRNSRADRSRRAAHSSIIYVLFLNSQERTLQSWDRGRILSAIRRRRRCLPCGRREVQDLQTRVSELERTFAARSGETSKQVRPVKMACSEAPAALRKAASVFSGWRMLRPESVLESRRLKEGCFKLLV